MSKSGTSSTKTGNQSILQWASTVLLDKMSCCSGDFHNHIVGDDMDGIQHRHRAMERLHLHYSHGSNTPPALALARSIIPNDVHDESFDDDDDHQATSEDAIEVRHQDHPYHPNEHSMEESSEDGWLQTVPLDSHDPQHPCCRRSSSPVPSYATATTASMYTKSWDQEEREEDEEVRSNASTQVVSHRFKRNGPSERHSNHNQKTTSTMDDTAYRYLIRLQPLETIVPPTPSSTKTLGSHSTVPEQQSRLSHTLVTPPPCPRANTANAAHRHLIPPQQASLPRTTRSLHHGARSILPLASS